MRFNLRPNNTSVQSSYGSTLAMHTVLRKTYFLLSLTLLFSGIMAAISMAHPPAGMSGFGLMIGMLGLFFLTYVLRNSFWGVIALFAFTGFSGYMLGPVLNAYIANFSNGSELILTSLGATGVIFVALSGYVLASKKDFSYLGGMLFVVLLGGLLVSIAGMIFNLPMLQIGSSAAFILIFSGYILYNTSQIIHGGETNYVMATLTLYLDILNLFLSLLRILSYFAGNRD